MTEQTPDKPTLTRYTITDPDDLNFAQMMGIKAATGVDLMNAQSEGHRLAALIWYAGRSDGLTFEQATAYTVKDFDFPDEVDHDAAGQDPLDDAIDEAAGPTRGSESPEPS